MAKDTTRAPFQSCSYFRIQFHNRPNEQIHVCLETLFKIFASVDAVRMSVGKKLFQIAGPATQNVSVYLSVCLSVLFML